MSIGRAVLGAAAFEKVLLVDIARRRADQEGLVEEVGRELSHLERRTAGGLLRVLVRLGVAEHLAVRIQDLIDRRNQLVHGFMEDASVVNAVATRELAPVVARVDQIAADCQALINEIAPPAFGALETMFGMSLSGLSEMLRSLELDSISDERLREQVANLRAVDIEVLRQLDSA